MFPSLIPLLLFLSAGSALAISDVELAEFSNSSQWKKILYFNHGKSLVLGDRYFLSQEGKENPLAELKATIDAFQSNRKNHEGYLYVCLFPARFKLLDNKWPGSFSKKRCTDFDNFKEGLDVDDVYLVFTSAYPNNPASMFGHTFLRFGRKKRGQSKSTKELLGYSVAFQARTDPNENPLMYTFKGLFGGYNAYAEIKPQYMNIGIYNNGESRDLWEYKLDLTEDEKELLIAHLWELSTSVTFPYYFFDENCSTFLVRLLEVIKPSLNFSSKDELFVVPQVTYREIYQTMGKGGSNYRASLKKNILNQYNLLSLSEKNDFLRWKKDTSLIALEENSIPTLDTLINFWKLKNYEAKTKLSPKDRRKLFTTMLSRSKISKSSNRPVIKIPVDEDPIIGHQLSSFGVGGNQNAYSLKFRYGFHDFSDNSTGFDSGSYIKFLDTLYLSRNHKKYFKSDIIDILSLQDFTFLFKDISWRVKLSYGGFENEMFYAGQGSIGLSKRIRGDIQLYTLAGLTFLNRRVEEVKESISVGMKYKLTSKLLLISSGEYITSFKKPNIKTELKYFSDNTSYGVESLQLERTSYLQFTISRYW